MIPQLISPPAVEPVSIDEAKAWTRYDAADQDALFRSLIVSARITLEAYTRRFFITQSWRLSLDRWPQCIYGDPLVLPLAVAPVDSITAIRVYDALRRASTLSPTSYSLSHSGADSRVVFLASPPSPGAVVDGIELDIVAGYGDSAADTPEPLRVAILALVAHWFENRGDGSDTGETMPPRTVALARPFRRERLI